MDTPHRQVDAELIERVLPRENVLVHAVDQRSIQIEQERLASVIRIHAQCPLVWRRTTQEVKALFTIRGWV